MAKRIGAAPTATRSKGRGARRQIPPAVTVAVIVVAVLVIGLIMWKTGIGGTGQMRKLTAEQQEVLGNPQAPFAIPGKPVPYGKEAFEKMQPTASHTPEAEKLKPKYSGE
jgi:hypothetical protein